MRIAIAFAAVAALAVAGCTTAGNANLAKQVDAACTRARAIIPSIQVLYDAGELSAKGRKTFVSAKAAVEGVCNAPPTDFATALLSVTTTYVAIKQLMKETK